MDGFDMLGAVDGLANEYITIRVKHIDRDKLKRKLGGGTGAIASSALSFVDASPRGALDMAVPVIISKAKDYGIDAEITVSEVPVAKGGRPFSEFWPGLIIGIGIGGAGLVLIKLAGKLVGLVIGGGRVTPAS